MPSPPNEACVMPPHKKTIRLDTMYVPMIPQVMPESMQAISAFERYLNCSMSAIKSIFIDKINAKIVFFMELQSLF